MNQINYKNFEQDKLDLSNQVRYLFANFPSLDMLSIELNKKITVKNGKIFNTEFFINLSKIGTIEKEELIYWSEKSHLSENTNGFFLLFLNFFSKKNFFIKNLQGDVLNWQQFNCYLINSFAKNYIDYWINSVSEEGQKFIFSRSHLNEDIHIFYGKTLNSKIYYNYLEKKLPTRYQYPSSLFKI